MTTHTPGPWRVTSHDDDSNYEIGGNSGRVFRIRHGLIPMLEDARLICAAPDLLAALQLISEDKDAMNHGLTVSQIRIVNAAIAKATGA